MGGIMARASCDNDELIDALVEESYIKSSSVEKVFRMVDRAEYFLPHQRGNAYNGLAWKSYHFHLSAPCVYSTVMEGLRLEPGLSFLNLGSGTGYLSTMVGLILGSNGLNHGIEYYADVVEYANTKLEDFKRYSGAIDEFDYCEPKFKQGNVLCLSSDFHAQYDRVYCGAAVPIEYESYMKNLLRVGGVLVMPVDDKLLQVRRLSTTQWEQESLLPVSFAVLIQPATARDPSSCDDGNDATVRMFDVEPMALQSLCRSVIRSILRKSIEAEDPKLKRVQRPPAIKKRKAVSVRRLVVPLLDSEDDSSDDERRIAIDLERHRRPIAELREGGDHLFNLVLGTFRGAGCRLEDVLGEDEDMDLEEEEMGMEEEEEEEADPDGRWVETRAVIERDPSQDNGPDNERNSTADDGDDDDDDDDDDDVPKEASNVTSKVTSKEHMDLYDVCDSYDEGETFEDSESNGEESDDGKMCPLHKANDNNRKKKRAEEDEIVNQTSDDDIGESMSSDADGDQREKRNKRVSNKDNKKAPKWRRLDSSEGQRGVGGESTSTSSSGGSGESADVEEEEDEVEGEEDEMEDEEEEEAAQEEEDDEMRMYESPYTRLMTAKIQLLPLPPMLKKYLSFYRGC